MRLDEMKLTRTLFPWTIKYRNYFDCIFKANILLGFSLLVCKEDERTVAKISDSSVHGGKLTAVDREADSVNQWSWSICWSYHRTASLGHLLSALGKCSWSRVGKASSKTLVWLSLWKHQLPGKLLVSAGILGGLGAANPNKPWTAEKMLLLAEGHWNCCILSVAVVLQVNNPAVPAFFRIKECSPGNKSVFAYRIKQDPCSSHMAVEHHSWMSCAEPRAPLLSRGVQRMTTAVSI